jgi:hypothetical protein
MDKPAEMAGFFAFQAIKQWTRTATIPVDYGRMRKNFRATE